MTLACACAQPTHEQARCGKRETVSARARLFAGLFDAPGAPVRCVRLLNPACSDEDPTTQRFARLEVD